MKNSSLQPRLSWRAHYLFLPTFYLTAFSTALFSFYPVSIGSSLSNLSLLLIYSHLGEIIGSLLFGLTRDYTSSKLSLLSCFFLTTCCGFLSLLQYYFEVFNYFNLMLLIFMGSGIYKGGVTVVQFAYISESVSDIDKLRVLSEISVFGLVGNSCSFLFVELIQDFSQYFGLIFGVCLIVSGLANFFIIFFRFSEFSAEKRVNRTISYRNYSKPAPLGIIICFLYSLALFYTKSIQEVMILEESKKTYTNQVLEVFLTGFGLWLIIFFSGKVRERVILLWFSIILILGWIFLIDFQVNSALPFYIGLTLTMTGFIITRCCTLVLLSIIIGPYPAGLYIGGITSTSSVGGILGLLTFPYTLPSSTFLTQILCSLTILLSLTFLLLFWKQCKAHFHNSKANKIIIELSCELPQQPLLNKNHPRESILVTESSRQPLLCSDLSFGSVK